MTTILGILIFAGFIFWLESAQSPFSVFSPVNPAKRAPRQRVKLSARLFWYCFIAICVGGIMLAMSQQARAQGAPVPALGCHAFNAQGRALQPQEMTDMQIMQALSCEKAAQHQDDFERQMADSNARSDALNAKMQTRADSSIAAPVAGYAAPIPTPLPGNTPFIVIQTQ